MTARGGTRERILKVSKALFAARGYEHSSTSAIAREAGTSESQLMKHFGSKAGLLEAIFADTWSKITEEARVRSREVAPAREKLNVISAVVLDAMERDPALKLLMLLEGRRIRREGQMIKLTDGFMSFVELIDSVLEQMKLEGEIRRDLNTHAIRSALMGMLEGMMRDRFLAERLGYPADFGTQEIAALMSMTLSSCSVSTSAAA